MLCRFKTLIGGKVEASDGAESGEEVDVDQNCSSVDKQSLQASEIVINPQTETDIAQDRIRINVSGLVFETSATALSRHSTTLLGSPAKRARYWVEHRLEYFFDRHRPSFDAIFAYLVEGYTLRRPPHVPSEIFLKEV